MNQDSQVVISISAMWTCRLLLETIRNTIPPALETAYCALMVAISGTADDDLVESGTMFDCGRP
jgi:hypothetical protein